MLLPIPPPSVLYYILCSVLTADLPNLFQILVQEPENVIFLFNSDKCKNQHGRMWWTWDYSKISLPLLNSGAYPGGGLWGTRLPGVTKGAPKNKKRERRERKEKRGKEREWKRKNVRAHPPNTPPVPTIQRRISSRRRRSPPPPGGLQCFQR